MRPFSSSVKRNRTRNRRYRFAFTPEQNGGTIERPVNQRRRLLPKGEKRPWGGQYGSDGGGDGLGPSDKKISASFWIGSPTTSLPLGAWRSSWRELRRGSTKDWRAGFEFSLSVCCLPPRAPPRAGCWGCCLAFPDRWRAPSRLLQRQEPPERPPRHPAGPLRRRRSPVEPTPTLKIFPTGLRRPLSASASPSSSLSRTICGGRPGN